MEETKNDEIKPEEINWQEKAEEYLAGWKRAMADYMNREKEIAKERDHFRQIIEDAFVLDFLPILDNLKAATSHQTESNAAWKGIEHTVKQFEDLLKSLGYEKTDVMDKEFDPVICEAAEKQGDGNKVVKVVVDGYKKSGRTVRPARVIVG
jgi:molecular chaperone GrpE